MTRYANLINLLMPYADDSKVNHLILKLNSEANLVDADFISAIRQNLFVLYEQSNDNKHRSIYLALIALAKLHPINEKSGISMEEIPEDKRCFTTHGYQFHIKLLIDWHHQRHPRNNEYQGKFLLNYYTNAAFSPDDCNHLCEMAQQQGIELQEPYPMQLPLAESKESLSEQKHALPPVAPMIPAQTDHAAGGNPQPILNRQPHQRPVVNLPIHTAATSNQESIFKQTISAATVGAKLAGELMAGIAFLGINLGAWLGGAMLGGLSGNPFGIVAGILVVASIQAYLKTALEDPKENPRLEKSIKVILFPFRACGMIIGGILGGLIGLTSSTVKKVGLCCSGLFSSHSDQQNHSDAARARYANAIFH